MLIEVLDMQVIPLKNMPLIEEGDDLGKLILEAIKTQNLVLENGDVFVVAQSIISKSEGNIINLSDIKPSERAKEIAEKIGKDPREVEVILQQTEEIVRLEHVLISQTKHGFICANAGVDSSNAGPDSVTILPDDPDESARKIREKIKKTTGVEPAVIITDSQGRAFRQGALGITVGVAGLIPISDLRGLTDVYEEELKSTRIATADALAAAGSIVMGEADEATPVAIIKDVEFEKGEGTVQELLRPREEDLFR